LICPFITTITPLSMASREVTTRTAFSRLRGPLESKERRRALRVS
jgi:hypothetical protein